MKGPWDIGMSAVSGASNFSIVIATSPDSLDSCPIKSRMMGAVSCIAKIDEPLLRVVLKPLIYSHGSVRNKCQPK